jgi:hypothetical protein
MTPKLKSADTGMLTSRYGARKAALSALLQDLQNSNALAII